MRAPFTREELRALEAAWKAEEREARCARKAQARKIRRIKRAQATQRGPSASERAHRKRMAQERAEVERIEAREREQLPPVVEPERPAERVITVGGATFVTTWYPHRDAQALVPEREERSSLTLETLW